MLAGYLASWNNLDRKAKRLSWWEPESPPRTYPLPQKVEQGQGRALLG